MTRTTKRKSTKKSKPVTLSEFKAWLEGVEELQPDEWHPDSSQWDLIRNKMLSIIEPEPQQAPQQNNNPPQYQPQPYAVENNPPPQQQQPQHDEMPTIIPGPPPSSSALPMDVDMTPAARAMMAGQPIPGTPGPDGKVKTPNIDTSNGKYTTNFE